MSPSDIEMLVLKTINHGDIYRFNALLHKIENADISGSVDRHSSHYVHEKSTDFTLGTDFRYATHEDGTELTPKEVDNLYTLASKVEEDIKGIVVDINRAIYAALEAEYEWRNADEQVEENIRANGFDFDEDGDRGGNLTFDQLEDRAKEKARSWYREGAFDDEWWEFIFDDWKEWLAKAGFGDDPEINFTGFWSQGDGASFTCNGFDLDKFCAMLSDPTTTQEKRLG